MALFQFNSTDSLEQNFKKAGESTTFSGLVRCGMCGYCHRIAAKFASDLGHPAESPAPQSTQRFLVRECRLSLGHFVDGHFLSYFGYEY